MVKKILYIFSLVLLIQFLFSQTLFVSAKLFSKEEIGARGPGILKIGVGARSQALADAYVGIAEGPTSIFWNPAGLSSAENKALSLMHSLWLDNFRHDFIGYAHPWKNRTIGLGINSLTTDPFEAFIGGEKVKNLNPYQGVITLSYSQPLRILSVGTNLKITEEKLSSKTIRGFAADLGILYKTIDERISMGTSIHNLGLRKEKDTWKDTLPLKILLGGCYKLYLKERDYNLDILNISLQLDAPIDNQISAHLGTEYILPLQKKINLAFRLGYKTNAIRELDWMAGFSSGIGIVWNEIGFDYAFAPYGSLGNTHRVSMEFLLGRTSKKEEEISNHYRLGKYYYLRKDWIKARNEFYEVLNLNPQDEKAGKFLTRIELKIRETLDPEILYLQAYAYYQKNDYEEAILLFRKVLSFNPAHKEARIFLSAAEEELNKIKHAKELKEKEKQKRELIGLRVEKIKKLYQAGVSAFNSSKLEKAIEEFEQILKIDPHHEQTADYLKKIGLILFNQYNTKGDESYRENDLEKAVNLWEKALKYDQGNKEVKQKIQEVSNKIKELKVAESKRYYDQGFSAYADKNYQEALKLWEKAYALDPQNLKAKRAVERVQNELKYKKEMEQ